MRMRMIIICACIVDRCSLGARADLGERMNYSACVALHLWNYSAVKYKRLNT